jgi:hypothetical protein
MAVCGSGPRNTCGSGMKSSGATDCLSRICSGSRLLTTPRRRTYLSCVSQTSGERHARIAKRHSEKTVAAWSHDRCQFYQTHSLSFTSDHTYLRTSHLGHKIIYASICRSTYSQFLGELHTEGLPATGHIRQKRRGKALEFVRFFTAVRKTTRKITTEHRAQDLQARCLLNYTKR